METAFKDLIYSRDNTTLGNAIRTFKEINEYATLFGFNKCESIGDAHDECIRQFILGNFEMGIFIYLKACLRLAHEKEAW